MALLRTDLPMRAYTASNIIQKNALTHHFEGGTRNKSVQLFLLV
jgi:hypothetical protein